MRKILESLRRAYGLPLVAVPVIAGVGVVLWGGFNWSLELANTETFCTSCHEMRDNVYREYRGSVHDRNRSGVRASCPDCHVPRDWWHKLVRKIGATNELYHWAIGTIDTREKFVAMRPALARSVWTSMQATDSRECRNCHDTEHMDTDTQKTTAGQMHLLATGWGMTCINCHQGIAHDLPEGFDREAVLDDLHDRIEAEKVECSNCHPNIRRARPGDDW